MAHAAAPAESVAVPGEHAVHTSTGLSNVKLGMWAFLGSECLLFGALISSYILYRGRAVGATKTPHQVYDIPYTSVSSFVLLMSSLTMVLALAAIQRGDQEKLRVWLMATALLGMTFIAGQVYEFTTFVQEGMTIKSNVIASAFFTLTGFHGAYVKVAIVLAIATAFEVGLYYLKLPHALLATLLLFFAVIKFSLVALWFMHLRFDSPIFRRMFTLGLGLALTVYLIVLTIFGVFQGKF